MSINKSEQLAVTYYYREPRNTGLSIEGIFKLVSKDLEDEVKIKEFICDPALSRFQNTMHARKSSGDINHITGDVNFLAIGLNGKKNVLTIHDLGFYENPVHSRLVKMVYRLFWFSLPLKNISIVTVVSQFTKDKLRHHFNFPADRIRVIPDPVKPVFRYSPKEKPGTSPVILMMGTGKHKNLDNLIEAVRSTDFHIDIIGWPSDSEIKKMVDYGISYKVYNLLTDEQVYDRYVACDVLFNASHYEGFGMPIIEAQAVGRPVITSNIGAMKEVGEGSAMLVSPDKPEEIRAAMLTLLDTGIYNDYVVRGVENAKKYDHRAIAMQYLAVYKELAGKKIK